MQRTTWGTKGKTSFNESTEANTQVVLCFNESKAANNSTSTSSRLSLLLPCTVVRTISPESLFQGGTKHAVNYCSNDLTSISSRALRFTFCKHAAIYISAGLQLPIIQRRLVRASFSPVVLPISPVAQFQGGVAKLQACCLLFQRAYMCHYLIQR